MHREVGEPCPEGRGWSGYVGGGNTAERHFLEVASLHLIGGWSVESGLWDLRKPGDGTLSPEREKSTSFSVLWPPHANHSVRSLRHSMHIHTRIIN